MRRMCIAADCMSSSFASERMIESSSIRFFVGWVTRVGFKCAFGKNLFKSWAMEYFNAAYREALCQGAFHEHGCR